MRFPYKTSLAIFGVFALLQLARASSSEPLMSRMLAVNPGLHSYQAAIHADISMKTFPYLSPSLDGTYYHKDPGQDKVEFTSGLPTMAKEFSRVYPEVPSPQEWNRTYVVTQGKDDGNSTLFKLVPRKHGRIDHIDVSVNDTHAVIISLRWNYNDGGYAELHQTFSTIEGNLLVIGQTGHFEVPLYKADVSSSFSNYKLNPALSDSFFQDR